MLDKAFSNQLPDTLYTDPDNVILERFIKEQENIDNVERLA
jgi:hypothetical protein